jgi:hypothetical protein
MLAGGEAFVEEVRDLVGDRHAAEVANAMEEVEIEGDYSRHAAGLRRGIEYVIARKDKTVLERILAIWKLCQVRGEITLPGYLGWT